ncbi:MAG: hypothetical protein K2G31_00840, partial [Clostridia bacterium]|nr:hypothetical protein [Clostridia bacterium]
MYKITFAIKTGLNNSTKTNVIWSNNETANQETTVTVSNLVVTVNGWNEKKEQSTVNLTNGGTASTRFFEYIIKDELGEIYSASDVLTAGVGKLFSIELAVKDSEAFKDANGNYYIEILYTDEKYQKLYFTTEKILIEKPELKIASKEFNRNEQSFEINDWTNLSKYLSMDQPLSYLRQTEAGTYSITFSFKENSVAVWSDGTAEPYTLTFTITAKEIEKPVVANAGYTGSEIDVLAQYLLDNGSDYIVINNDSNKGTAAGEYTLSLSLKYPDSTVWAGGDNEDLELKWNITQNKLSTPSNNGKWTVFDGANHDLYELCGLQSDWSNFYNVTIQYSADGETYGTFNGNTAYNAGSYKLTFQIKAELNPEGAENVVWSKDGSKDDIEIIITVAKLELNVIAWNENKNASTVQLESGSLPESGVSYMFRNASGTEVTEADVLAAGEGMKFSKELVVSDTTNIAVNYEEATLKRYYFVMVVHEMEIPELTTTSVAYTGKNNIFYINDWDLYSPYVEIVADASDSLTQQDAGNYQVVLRIKDTTIATWSDGSTDDVTLYFEITQIVVSGRWDSKNLPHTFVVMGDYPVSNDLLATLTYTDKDGATVTAADLKQGGTYTATVAIARSYATNYVFDADLELTSTFTMPIDYTELSLPTLRNAKLAYNGA